MDFRAERFPSYGLAVNVYSGAATAEEIIGQIKALEPGDIDRWINYLDPTFDMSGVDVASIPELKRTVAAMFSEREHSDRPAMSALVSPSGPNELFRHFWPSYVGRDQSYPTEPEEFSSIAAACEWLGLSEAARRDVIGAVES